MFLFLFISTALCQYMQRIIDPAIQKLYDFIETRNYSSYIGTTIILQYSHYLGVYSMQLSLSQGKEQIPQINDVDFDHFQKIGCWTYERRLFQKTLLEIAPNDQLYGSLKSESAFLTSMYMIGRSLFVTRSDYILLSFLITVDEVNRQPLTITMTGHHNISEVINTTTINEEQIVVCLKQYSNCYVFTDDGALYFHSSNLSVIDDIKPVTLNKSKLPKHVYIDQNLQALFLSYGIEGIDIYAALSTGQIAFQCNIPAEGKNFIQTKMNDEATILYALDQINGLYLYEINTLREVKKLNYYINLLNCKSFDFYRDTIFIVAQAQNQLSYAIEVLLNRYNQSYYFNKIYSKDSQIDDIYVTQHYAVLIGALNQKIVYHSIYNKFQGYVPNNLYFQKVDLVDVEEIKLFDNQQYNIGAFDREPLNNVQMQYQQSFMVGLSDSNINLFSVKNIYPWIQCKANSTDKLVYQLLMNSTQCNRKTVLNDESPFTQCTVNHNFTFEGKSILFNEKDKMKVIIFASIFAFILLLSLSTYCYCKRKWKYLLQKYQDLNEIEEIRDPQEIKPVFV